MAAAWASASAASNIFPWVLRASASSTNGSAM
jgi:hypothetical protein